MTRTRPRNVYRSPVLTAITLRHWLRRIGHDDLDAAYRNTLEDTMPLPDVAISITIRGRERRLTFPTIQVGNVNAARPRLDWWRQTAAADQVVLDAAEAVLRVIERAQP